MGNYFLDNQDIRFLFEHIDLAELARIQEADTANGDADYVPIDEDDAVDNYRRVLEIVGQIAADTLAPHAEQVAEVVGKLDHVCRPGTKRTGV